MTHAGSHAAPTGAIRALARPKALAIGCIAVLAAAGWIYLGLMAAGNTGAGWLAALCRPTFASVAPGAAQVVLIFAMWGAMALAMMLPTAAPMIVTYAELAETAAAKGEPAASPLVLIAGYVAVWLGAAPMFTLVQVALARLSLLDPALAYSSSLFSGVLFLVAGLYQFSPLKHACVTQCQHPFRFFFANWTARPIGVFGHGLRQGLYCFGCCWAMMLLMFAVGVMNVIWMAALGIVMTVEKMGTTAWFSRALGVAFILIGSVLIIGAVVAS
jgi:predicted metal-binding membrane protein